MDENTITYTTWTRRQGTAHETTVDIADPRAIRFSDDTVHIEIRPDVGLSRSTSPHPLVYADFGADGELVGISLSGPAAKAIIKEIERRPTRFEVALGVLLGLMAVAVTITLLLELVA